MRKFQDEFDYLIHLVRCAVHGEAPQELPEGFDFQRVYECGEYHHIANIAFYSVEKLQKNGIRVNHLVNNLLIKNMIKRIVVIHL